MKIAICMFQIMDLGGIINHTEELIGGLQDLGHDVHFMELVYSAEIRPNRKRMDETFIVGPSGIPHHQFKGWNFGPKNRRGYKTRYRAKLVRDELNKFDAVIWTIPVPTRNARNEFNVEWPILYDLDPSVTQVAIVHDGNAKKGYPHLLHVADHLDYIVGVHDCAVAGADFLPVKRTMIVNPQREVVPARRATPWADRRKGFVSMQTFKAWKKVHELVSAIPYMPEKEPGEQRFVAGEGIEYRYMTSEDKIKALYIHPQKVDGWFAGERIWDAALACGMDRPPNGYWTADEVDDVLHSSRILVDPSFSNGYSKVGGHFNRVMVDAIRCGAVPMANPKAVGDAIFKEGIHYLPLDRRNPKLYAESIVEAWNMPRSEYIDLAINGFDIFSKYFERMVVAQRFIDLIEGSLDKECEFGVASNEMRDRSDDMIRDFFHIED